MLYIVGTPIGNLQDFSDRGKEILSTVELILCEDTRVTGILLAAFEIETPRESMHEHTDSAKIQKLVSRLEQGESMAFVSDAGTPGVSDPGGKLVQAAVAAGVEIIAVPGPSALATAMSLADFPVVPMSFLGFPPQKKGRDTFFRNLKEIEHAVILYESKHRIEKTLAFLPYQRYTLLGRELTKKFETVYRGTPPELLETLSKGSQKGEYVIVIAPKNWKA